MHPGYGFLAENAEFAREVEEAGSCGSARRPRRSRRWGRRSRRASGCAQPACRSCPGRLLPRPPSKTCSLPPRRSATRSSSRRRQAAAERGCASRAPRTRSSGPSRAVRREGEAYFADSAVYVERYLEDPRHVEVQVLADSHGNVVHLGERDCTIQRRHQKLVEETPSPAVDDELRLASGRSRSTPPARSATDRPGRSRACSTSTVTYYFLEMNTRVQVEHTVTEAVTGIDIVREQILIAAGEPLSMARTTSCSAATPSSAGSTPRT